MIIEPVRYRSTLIRSPRQMRHKMVGVNSLDEKQYLVKIEVCGLCHSDVVWFDHRADEWQKIGHEFGGVIVAGGRANGKYQTGQRVAIKNAAPCYGCRACKSKDFRSCQNVIVNKSGFDQYCVADERSLVDASELEDWMLGLVEPLSVANDLLVTADIGQGDSVIIYGLGTIGLLVGWLSLQHGASKVIGVSRSRKCFGVAKQLGFAACTQTDEIESGLAVNKVCLLAPASELNEAVSLLTNGGTVTVAGLNDNSWHSETKIDAEEIIFKRVTIKGSFGYPNLYFEDAVEQLTNRGEDLRMLITHSIKLSALERIFKVSRDEIKTIVENDL